MKKVSKYLTITLLMLLGLCSVGVLFLFFVPDSSIFGITYISKQVQVASTPVSASSINRVVLNSRSYNVNIKSTNEGNIYAEIDSKSFGFVHKKNKTATISQNSYNNSLLLDIAEPKGFIYGNNSSVTLYLPKSSAMSLSINNKNATVTVNDESVTIKNLYYNANKGKLNLINGSVTGSIDLNLSKSTCTIYKEFKTNRNATTIKTTTGKLIAKESVLGNVEVLSSKRGTIQIFECKDFIFKPTVAGGVVGIDKLEQAQVITSDTNLYFGKITSGGTIEMSDSGKVQIEELNGSASITTKSGNITINKSLSPISVKSKTGNITINNAYQGVTIDAVSGKVTVSFAEDAKSDKNTATGEYYRTLHATLKGADLTAYGVEHVGEIGTNSGIYASGNGKVTIHMINVFGTNDIKTNSNSCFVKITKTATYTLTTNSSHGSVRVNLTQTPEYNGYTDITKRVTHVNSSSQCANTLNVSTESGHLTLVDTLAS